MNTNTKYLQYFITNIRKDTGKAFIKCTEDAPEELRELIRKIHDGRLPSDWIYEMIRDAFEELEEIDLEDIMIEGDPYYSQLLEWLGESCAQEYCAEVLQEHGSFTDIYDVISEGQKLAKRMIYEQVNDFLQG